MAIGVAIRVNHPLRNWLTFYRRATTLTTMGVASREHRLNYPHCTCRTTKLLATLTPPMCRGSARSCRHSCRIPPQGALRHCLRYRDRLAPIGRGNNPLPSAAESRTTRRRTLSGPRRIGFVAFRTTTGAARLSRPSRWQTMGSVGKISLTPRTKRRRQQETWTRTERR